MFKLNILNYYFARVISKHINVNFYVMFRKQVRYFFGPLYKAPGIRVKIFFVAHIKGFALVFKPVKIKMVNFFAVADIFIHNGKGRAGYQLGNAQAFT